MHVHSPIFKANSLKKIRSITFIVWVLGRVEKNAKKDRKNVKNIFFLNKHLSVTHVSTSIFQGLFKNKVFRSVALVTKKLWAILEFFFTHS